MRNARLQIRGSFFGKDILVQARHRCVEFLHDAAEITDQCATFAGEIVDAGFAGAIEVGVWLQEFCRYARRHSDTDKSVTKQTGTSNREFASFGNFYVIVNL